MSKRGNEDSISEADVIGAFGVPSVVDGSESILDRLDARLSGADAPSSEEAGSEAEIAKKIEAKIEPEAEDSEETETEASEDSTDDPDALEEADETDEEGDEDSEDEEKETEDEETADETDELELSEEQIAGVLGLSDDGAKIDEEGELTIRTQVDGEPAYVPLKDLVTSYQLEKHLRNKSSKDAEARRDFEDYRATETETLKGSVADATALVQALEQELINKHSPEQLNHLRETNPAEWAAIQAEMQAKFNHIGAVKQQLREVINTHQTKQQKEFDKKTQTEKTNYIEEQATLLVEKIPTWADRKVAQTEVAAMQQAVIDKYGFSREEVDQVNDHRMFLIFRDAIRGKEIQTSAPLKKRLKRVPKLVKSQSKVTKGKATKRKQAQRKQQIVKESGGSTQSIADLIYDRI